MSEEQGRYKIWYDTSNWLIKLVASCSPTERGDIELVDDNKTLGKRDVYHSFYMFLIV